MPLVDVATPLTLGPNLPGSFYRGSGAILDLRGLPGPADPYQPEDWIASTTTRFGQATSGLTTLPDGTYLREAVTADPQSWLGPEHVAAFGADTGLLLKFLDSGQRLPVHVHPNQEFARQHLNSRHGKTEAWIILRAKPGATVHVGFDRDVTSEELARWVAEQDTAALLGTTNAIPVSAGDAFLCPAQVPHAIGEGILLLELQEPTDFSILLESKGFTDPEDGHLGLGYDTALRAVDRESWSPEKLARLHVEGDRILPPAADPFFRADWCRDSSRLEAGFGVLVVTEGTGQLRTAAGVAVPLAQGSTTLIPYAAGECTVDGELTAIHCRPPAAP